MKNLLILTLALFIFGCNSEQKTEKTPETPKAQNLDPMDALLGKYTTFKLTTDVSTLSAKEKKMIPLLIQAAKIMDDIYWFDAYGDKNELLSSIKDSKTKEFVKINYGPWDRLGGNKSFVEGIGAKPLGANFYPKDMTKDEFEKSNLKDKASQYTYIRRNDKGELYTIPYHEQFKDQIVKVGKLLQEASYLAEDSGLKHYLDLRSKALMTDQYYGSDLAWLNMKNNHIDVVIGPIENYEDAMFGYKTSHSAYILVKDMEWSKKLEKYAAFLPELQKGLPVDAKYKQEKPGTDTELNAYDVIYYAGDCNAGSKTIAINLPNDEKVQLKKGTRRLQLKNAMKAKFDKILTPIADMLIADDLRDHINFNAFFSNTMFHEVAHGLGIKNTINGQGLVRKTLKEHASALEEGKADILGLYMINQLHKKGEIEGDLKDYHVTFMASIFRSIRFGASSAHGKANMIRFNFFKEMGAFERDSKTGKYSINFDKFAEATQKLSELILTLQGDGAYDKVAQLVKEKGVIHSELQADLDRLGAAGIPVDVVFEQGVDVLGL